MAARPRTAAARSRGKDPTKVDRSAAYVARYLAKNIVAAGLRPPLHDPARLCDRRVASRCRSMSTRTAPARSATTQIEAAIGRIEKLGGLTPRGIRTHLGLNKPIYAATAAYGHFGRKAEGDFFPWEKTDLVDDLKAALA